MCALYMNAFMNVCVYTYKTIMRKCVEKLAHYCMNLIHLVTICVSVTVIN